MVKAVRKLRRDKKASPSNKKTSATSHRKAAANSLSKISAVSPPFSSENRAALFDPLELISRVLMAQDMLFLSRQVAYHIASAENLSEVWADTDRMRIVLSKLIEHVVKRAPRRSDISVSLKGFSLRRGLGVEFKISSTDRLLEEMDASAFMASLFSGEADPESGICLTECRETILRQRGRFWVDLPKPSQPVYHLILPSSKEVADGRGDEHYTFKYDIMISNFNAIRKRFGIRKSFSLVGQIEHYVRALVRYPMDMVMSIGNEGMITAIYETQSGTAESVASRISQRLGKEVFRIGKKPVELLFQYNLSALNVTPLIRHKTANKRSP